LPGNWCQVIKPELPSIFTPPSPSPSRPLLVPDGVFERLPQVGFEKGIQWRKIDLNSYEKVHYFGDLQGCYSPLQVYFKNHGTPAENPNHFYIFVGDLLDRGKVLFRFFSFSSFFLFFLILLIFLLAVPVLVVSTFLSFLLLFFSCPVSSCHVMSFSRN
jgi:hypothetical protein